MAACQDHQLHDLDHGAYALAVATILLVDRLPPKGDTIACNLLAQGFPSLDKTRAELYSRSSILERHCATHAQKGYTHAGALNWSIFSPIDWPMSIDDY